VALGCAASGSLLGLGAPGFAGLDPHPIIAVHTRMRTATKLDRIVRTPLQYGDKMKISSNQCSLKHFAGGRECNSPAKVKIPDEFGVILLKVGGINLDGVHVATQRIVISKRNIRVEAANGAVRIPNIDHAVVHAAGNVKTEFDAAPT